MTSPGSGFVSFPVRPEAAIAEVIRLRAQIGTILKQIEAVHKLCDESDRTVPGFFERFPVVLVDDVRKALS